MFKRKLFKRALPIILSVAMVFQSMPATALAAEDPAVVETNVEDSGTTDSADETTASEVEAPASENQEQSDASQAGDTQQEETPDTTADPEGAEQAPDTVADPDNTGTEGTDIPASENGQGETTAEDSQEAAADAAETAQLKTELSFDNGSINGFRLDDTGEDPTYVTTYRENSNAFDSVINSVKYNVRIKVDNADKANVLRNYLSFAWGQVASDGTVASMSGLPSDAGTYRLEVSVEKVDGLIGDAEPLYIYFEIEKAKVSVTELTTTVSPQTTAADFLKGIKEKYQLTLEDGTAAGDRDAFIDAFTPKVVVIAGDDSDGTVVGDEEQFDKRRDYRLKIDVTFKADAAKNYEPALKDYWVITVGDLTETEVIVTLANPGEEITTDYAEGKAVKIADLVEPKLSAENPVKVVYDKDGEKAAIEGAAATPAWYTREQLKLSGSESIADTIEDEYIILNGYKYVKCDDPVDAGEYYVIYKYDGDNGHVYDKSVSEPIRVTINALPVIIVPDAITISEGMDRADIDKLLTKAAYTIYYEKEDGTLGEKFATSAELADKTPDFFGVSYDGDEDSKNIQYYGPVFEIQQRFTPNPKEGETLPEENKNPWTAFTGTVKSSPCTVNGKEGTMDYRIRFTGEKAVYNNAGTKMNSVSVTDTTTNSADKNRLAKADKDTLDKNAVELTRPESAVKTAIDTTDIKSAFDGEAAAGTLDQPLWKIYNGETLYKDRAAYKKAKVTDAATGAAISGVASTDDSIKYTWQQMSLDKYTEAKKYAKQAFDRLEEDEKKKYADFDAYLSKYIEDNYKGYWSGVTSDNLGSTSTVDGALWETYNANFYRLHIEYTDKDHKNLSSEADVYFMIKRQEIIVVADEQRANYGDSVTDYEDKYFVLALLEGNKEPEIEDPAQLTAATSDDGMDALSVALKWNVRRLEKDANGVDIQGQYKELVSNGVALGSENTFVKLDGPSQYRYEAYATFDNKSGSVSYYDEDGRRIWVYDKYDRLWNWSNFTNVDQDKTAADEDGKTQYHFWSGEIKFNGEKELKVVVSNMPSDRTYDGTTTSLPTVQIFDGDTEKTADLLNTTGIYNEKLVNVRWKWIESEDYLGRGNALYPIAAQYGGTYTLCVYFNGNDEYKSFDSEKDDYEGDGKNNVFAEEYSFKITPRDITITPVVNKDVTAGELVGTLIGDSASAPYEISASDVAPGDEWLFKYENDGKYFDNTNTYTSTDNVITYKGCAIFNNSPAKTVYADKKEVNGIWNSYLRYGKEYTVKYTTNASNIRFPWTNSYNITYKYSEAVSPKRGNAWVGKASNAAAVDVIETVDDKFTHTITPRQAIPFVYDIDDDDETYYLGTDCYGNEIPRDKNYIAYRIYAPKEFAGNIYGSDFGRYSDNFVYKNSIKDAGGYVLSDTWEANGYDERYITVLFPVAKDEDGKIEEIPEFKIVWESGYTETFKLSVADAELEANLKKAVAPKSLAFNGVNTKMTVGDTQSLDVKITKAQLGDVILINYRLGKQSDENITSNDYASIDPRTGVITALNTSNNKPVKVSVEAYPVYLADDGRTYKEIEGKGVKVAKTTITISDVTAPVIKKIDQIQDYSARLQFTRPDNGYRREIYVVKVENKADIKSWNKDKFETEIKNMKNGQWSDSFAIKPIFISGGTDYAEKQKLVVIGDKTSFGKNSILGRNSSNSFSGFEANTNYVVYVRNVSAARTLDDGSKVALSANGTVKNFATTKAQVKSLPLGFTVNENNVADAKNTVTIAFDRQGSQIGYTVDLSRKSAQLNVYGNFVEKEDAEKPAAEDKDRRRYELPIKDKTLLNTYLNPKLSYAVYDDNASSGWKDKDGYSVSDPWLAVNATQSKYAAISNKGKLSLKGVALDGVAWVRIYVKADNGVYNSVRLRITAVADTVTAKAVKMKVGDTVRLADYLEYKFGKTKVPSYRSSAVTISSDEIKKAAEQGYEIVQHQNESGYFNGEWTITAVAPNKAKTELEITDTLSYYDEEGNLVEKPNTVKVSLTSAQLDPVKSLKVAYVDDKHITLNFAHAGTPEAFAIEVKDARNSVVYSKVAYNANKYVVDKYQKASVQNRQQWRYEINRLTYFEKTKTYSYTISSNKLVRLSSYTVSVTPLYRGEKSAKAVSVKAKTTNIPASYSNVEAQGNTDDFQNTLGGVRIYCGGIDDYISGRYFVSGNTYTLSMDYEDINTDAKDRVTDTLTWKSSNTKVASVKANPGTYTATFKALQKGQTTITVTSKITKKVIARWAVSVKAVGDSEYYRGDFEYGDSDGWFYRNILPITDPYYEGRLEVLTMSTPLKVHLTSGYDRTWVSFTAPSFGEYTFIGASARVYNSAGEVITSIGNGSSIFLEAGQKIYLKVYYSSDFTLSVSATEFAKLTAANDSRETGLEVKANQWVSFTAPEKNFYTFVGDINYYGRKDNKQVAVRNGISLDAGETVFVKASTRGPLYVTYMNAGKDLLEVDKEMSLTFTKDTYTANEDSKTQYVKFTAPATAKYTFTVKNASDVTYYDLEKNELSSEGRLFNPSAKAVNADGDEGTTEVNERTFVQTIERGITIVAAITVNKEDFGADVTEIKPTISVAQSGTQEITAGSSIDIEAKATEFVSFKIPDTGNVKHKYVFNTTNARINAICKSDGTEINSISAIVVPGNQIKAGDTVYIEVENTSNTEKAKLELADKYAEKLTTGRKEESVKDGDEYWYTFTAEKAGYYTFSTTTTPGVEGETAHEVTFAEYYSEFGSYKQDVPSIKQMKLGEKLVLKLSPSTALGDSKVSKTAIEITPVEITPLSLAKEITVSTTKKDETKYYSFTAAEDDNYIFEWTRDKDKNGDVSVLMGSDLRDTYSSLDETELSAGDVRYIKVQQTGEKEVTGTLKVTTEKSQIKTLASGKAADFDLKAGESATYRFTVPSDELLGWAVTASTTKTDDAAAAPEVEVSVYGSNGNGNVVYFETRSLQKDDTYTLTVTAGEADAKGSVKIEPVTAAALGDKLEVTKEKPIAWYKTTISESGRYLFEDIKDDENCSVYTQVYVVKAGAKALGSSGTWTGKNESYFEKGDVIYVKAYNNLAETKQTATIKAPALINPSPLALDEEVKLDVTEGGKTAEYYVFTAPETAVYELTYTTGMVTVKKLIPENGSDDNMSLSSSLKKDDKIFVTVNAGASGVKITKKGDIKVLKDNEASDDETIKPGESAYFSYQVYEAGMYTFKVSADNHINGVVINPSGTSRHTTGDFKGFYTVREYSTANQKVLLTVPNNTADNMTIKVTVTKTVPTELTLGTKAPVTINKGEVEWVTFKAPADGTYKFTTGNADVKINNGVTFESYLNKGEEQTYKLTVATDKEDVTSAAAEVLVTTVSATDVKNGDTIKVAANDIGWYVFTADKAASYSFEVKNDNASANVGLYKRINGSFVSGAQYLEEGDKIYIRVDNSANKDEAEYTFTAAGKEPELNKSLTFDETSGQSQTFTFTVPETGIYKYTMYNKTANGGFDVYKDSQYLSWVSSDYNKDNPYTYLDNTLLKKGEEVNFEVIAYGGLPHTIIIRGELQQTATPITSSEEEEYPLTSGNNYLVYTAEKAGTYIFTRGEDGYGYSTELTLNGVSKYLYSNGSQMLTLEKDDTVILRTYSSSSGNAIKLKVAELITTQLPIGESAETYKLAGNGETYYKLVAEKTAVYTVTLERGSNAGYCYLSDSDYWNGTYSNKSYDLKAGDEILLKVRNTSSDETQEAEYSLKVEENTIVPISMSSYNSYSIEAWKTREFKFTATSQNWYSLYFYNVGSEENVIFEYSVNGSSYNTFINSDKLERYLNSGDEIQLRVTNNTYNDLSVGPRVSSMYFTNISGDTYSANLSEGQIGRYMYTVSKTGQYKISYTGTSSDVLYARSDKAFEWLSYENTEDFYALTDGDKILFKIVATDSATLSIAYQPETEEPDPEEPTVPEEWDMSTPLEIKSSGEEQRFALTFNGASVGDNYVIYASDESLELNLYKADTEVAAVSDNDTVISGKGRIEFLYESGAAYEIGVTPSEKITLTCITPEIKSLTLGSDSDPVTLKGGSECWFTLESVDEGTYEIKCTYSEDEGAEYPEIQFSADVENGEYSVTKENPTFDVALSSSDSITIKSYVKGHESTEVSYTLTITKKGTEQETEPTPEA